MKIVDFEAYHIDWIELQPAQGAMDIYAPELRRFAKYMRPGEAYTGIQHGRVIFCAGVYPKWRGSVILWTFLSTSVNARNMLSVHRNCKKLFEDYLQGKHLNN